MSMNISNIPDERLDEFRRIYFEEFGEKISRQEASVRALQLIDLYRLLMDREPRRPASGSKWSRRTLIFLNASRYRSLLAAAANSSAAFLIWRYNPSRVTPSMTPSYALRIRKRH
jgi:hypothetical protein